TRSYGDWSSDVCSSDLVYDAPFLLRRAICPTVGGGAATWVERPQSRLSNRTTWNPRPASCEQNSSGQPIIWVARPMTRSIGGSRSEERRVGKEGRGGIV